jgi:hypothetical protein
LPQGALTIGAVSNIGTLRFVVPLAGEFAERAVTVDLSQWSRPKLARAFAKALRDDLLAPGTLATMPMVRTRLAELNRFWRFLDESAEACDGIEAVSADLLDRYEVWLRDNVGGGDLNRRHLLARPIALLRLIELDKPGTLQPATVERLGYLSLAPFERSVPRDAYSGAVTASIRRAAREQVLGAARRIALRDDLPPVPDGIHPKVQARYARLLADIDRRGIVPVLDPVYSRLTQMALRLEPALNLHFEEMHGRFHLTVVDVVGFLILLSLETGIEIECLKRLKADCLRNPAKGSVDIEYLKRRARGAEWKRLRVRDGGSGTPGGLVRLALKLTERARRHRSSDALWVYVTVFGLAEGVKGNLAAGYFVRAHKLVDDAGQPLRLELSRLRKTYKAEWYVKTGGQMEDFAVGHSVEVAANHYADIPALKHLHEQTVATALQDALDVALKPTLVLPDAEDAIRADPSSHTDLPVPPAEAIAFLDGAQDLWLVSCGGFYDSPFGCKGRACPVPFWGCLECKNAVITSRKLPALIAFQTFMIAQREQLSAGDWAAKFAGAHRRIAEQILPAFPEAQVAAARAIAATRQDILYLPPEAGAR